MDIKTLVDVLKSLVNKLSNGKLELEKFTILDTESHTKVEYDVYQ